MLNTLAKGLIYLEDDMDNKMLPGTHFHSDYLNPRSFVARQEFFVKLGTHLGYKMNIIEGY